MNRTESRTNIQTDERKDENDIHLCINARGMNTSREFILRKSFNTIVPFLAYLNGISMNQTMRGCKTTHAYVSMMILMLFLMSLRQFPPNISTSTTYKKRNQTEHFLIEKKKCSYFSVKLRKRHIFKPKCSCRKKSRK